MTTYPTQLATAECDSCGKQMEYLDQTPQKIGRSISQRCQICGDWTDHTLVKKEEWPEETPSPKECLRCGTWTTRRIDGDPFCSAECIGAYRSEAEPVTIQCPYPECDWEHEHDPDQFFLADQADRLVENHREEHRDS